MGRFLISCTLLMKLKQSISGISISAMIRSKLSALSSRIDSAIVGSSVVVTVKKTKNGKMIFFFILIINLERII